MEKLKKQNRRKLWESRLSAVFSLAAGEGFEEWKGNPYNFYRQKICCLVVNIGKMVTVSLYVFQSVHRLKGMEKGIIPFVPGDIPAKYHPVFMRFEPF